MPFPSCFMVEILILTFSQLEGGNFVHLLSWIGGFGLEKIEKLLHFEIYVGHVLVMV